MVIGTNEINFDMTLEELKTIEDVVYERVFNMENDLDNVSSHQYIKLRQLLGKMCGLMALVENKQKTKNEMAEISHS